MTIFGNALAGPSMYNLGSQPFSSNPNRGNRGFGSYDLNNENRTQFVEALKLERELEEQKNREEEQALAKANYEQRYEKIDSRRKETWNRYTQEKDKEAELQALLNSSLIIGDYREAAKLKDRIRTNLGGQASLFSDYMFDTSSQMSLALKSF